jgi:hypothetical protein
MNCPTRVGGYERRSKVIAAIRSRLEGTKTPERKEQR